MKPSERDAILGRLEERTCNIYKLAERQEQHLVKLNNTMGEHAVGIAVNKTSIKLQWKVIGGIFALLSGGLTLALKLLGVY